MAVEAHACPLIHGMVDSNCDQVLKIGFVGDSFVAGVGDGSDLGGGYVGRIAREFPDIEVVSFPKPGIVSGILLSRLIRAVPRMNSNHPESDMHDTDIIIIDVGRNDFWKDNYPPRTVGNIKRIVSLFATQLSKGGKTPPVIAVNTLATTNRVFQAGFIENVNFQLLEQRSNLLPVFIRMDKLRSSLISHDGLHPNSSGYDKMAQIIKDYLTGKGKSRALAICRDNDSDGIFDKFEASKFGTNPALADTDSDGYSDGDEVFTYHTDPVDAVSHP